MVLIIALAFYMAIDQNGPVIVTWFPAIIGVAVGLIMGDMPTALTVGGTFQMMALGIAQLGGSSVPNYGLATIIGSYVAIKNGESIESAIAIGIPVGILGIQLDVLVKLINNFVARRAQSFADQGKFKRMRRTFWLGPLFFGLSTAIPTAIAVLAGPKAVQWVLDAVPNWVNDGLGVAAGILPIVGISILMHFMPVQKHLVYLIIGFVLAAFLNVPILGAAILGFGFAYTLFRRNTQPQSVAVGTPDGPSTGDDYDE